MSEEETQTLSTRIKYYFSSIHTVSILLYLLLFKKNKIILFLFKLFVIHIKKNVKIFFFFFTVFIIILFLLLFNLDNVEYYD